MASTFTPSHRGGSGTPLVCLHGFMETWRTWELVLPVLERHHDVLAPTLPGHAGGPPLESTVSASVLPDAVERAMDSAGFASAHVVGNSLGGFVALQLAERGRARSIVALAPAGGWAEDDDSFRELLARQATMQQEMGRVAVHAPSLLSSTEGRRRASELVTANFEHIPVDLLADLILGVSICDARPLVDFAMHAGYSLEAEQVTCPVRVVWGADDKLLPWPRAAARFREEWLPSADWVELDGVGHCPQLDVPLETAQLIIGFTTPTRPDPRS